jgi:hypothetical protein
MKMPRDMAWTLISSGVAVGASLVARKAVTAGWEKAAGKEPPVMDEDVDVSWVEAIAWAAAIGAAVGIARVVARRSAAVVFEKATGAPAIEPSKP